LESGGVDHRRSLYHGPHIVGRRASIQSWDITASAGVTTTRAGKCRMSVGTAARPARRPDPSFCTLQFWVQFASPHRISS
jgi:hypothetical protein